MNLGGIWRLFNQVKKVSCEKLVFKNLVDLGGSAAIPRGSIKIQGSLFWSGSWKSGRLSVDQGYWKLGTLRH